MKEIARVIGRWHALAPQIAKDFRHHWHVRGVPSPALSRFVEQLRLLWSNRIKASDYYSLGLFDPQMSAARKRRYVGTYQNWQLFMAFAPKEFHDLLDNKLQFNTYAARANLPTTDVLAVVSRESGGDGIVRLRAA